MRDEQVAARAGDAAGLAAFVALTYLGERRLHARVAPALAVRRHVHAAAAELAGRTERKRRKKKLVKVAAVVLLVALAARGLQK